MKTKLSRQQVLAQKLYNGNGLFPNELKEYKELVAQDAAKKMSTLIILTTQLMKEIAS